MMTRWCCGTRGILQKYARIPLSFTEGSQACCHHRAPDFATIDTTQMKATKRHANGTLFTNMQ